MKKWLVISFAVALMFGYLVFQSGRKPSNSLYKPNHSRIQKLSDNLQDFFTSSKTIKDETSAQNSADSGSEKWRQIRAWIASESKKLNFKGIDSAASFTLVKNKILLMSNEEKNELAKLIFNIELPVVERIFSTFMLTSDIQSGSVERLSNLSQKEIHNFGEPIAHSEAELRRQQELALRYMMIDELAERSQKNDLEAQKELKKIAESAVSLEVRNYAKRNLYP